MSPTILHADMNACYASIEQARNPALRGKAMAVCGSVEARNGIILAKSQEAKIQGVKTGEAIWEAQQKCPGLLLVPADFSLYLAYSKMAHHIYLDYTNRVEAFGMDECWLDVTGTDRLFGDGETLARTLRRRFRDELEVTISVGISDNKFFAKLGSDYKKPDAQTRIDRSNYKEVAWPLPASNLLFCGPQTTRKLARFGIHTIGDLARSDPEFIRKLLGINGYRLWLAANGRDRTPVAPYDFRPPIKSLGCGTTFRRDLVNRDEVALSLRRLAKEVEGKLLSAGLSASRLSLSVRDNTLFQMGDDLPLPYPTQNAQDLADRALDIFDGFWFWKHRVRAMTLRASRLLPQPKAVQRAFFPDYPAHEKKEDLSRALFAIRSRFGSKSVDFAALYGYDYADLDRDRADMPTNKFVACAR